jgi:hypothetical protein
MKNVTDIDQLLSGMEEDRRIAHQQVNERFDADIAALKRSRELLLAKQNFPATITSAVPKTTALGGPAGKWPGLRPAMRIAMANASAEFNIEDILHGIQGFDGAPTTKRNAVSSELWRMERKKEIELVKAGRPNIYRKPANGGRSE